MLVGYCRTSTVEQIAGLDSQVRDLKAIGAEKIFKEQVSSVAHRDQLEAAIEFCREGDTLVVTKLDRLARSVRHLCELVDRLQSKNVALRILAMNMDTGTPTGKMMLTILGSVAQFEREAMLERQKEGVQRAKGLGRYTGRAPTARKQLPKILELVAEGKTREQVAEELGIHQRSVFRLLAEHKSSIAGTPKPRARERG